MSIVNCQKHSRKVILLVEDNEQVMQGNKRMLERAGYDTACAATLAAARALIDKLNPDAIILDLMLPDGSGFDFMAEVRRTESSRTPILLLTGLRRLNDKVRGLKEGGDDYLTKPYDFEELLARVEALLRRAQSVPETIRKGTLTLETFSNKAFIGDDDLTLTGREFDVLFMLAQNEDKLLKVEHIYETIWKQPLIGNKNAAQIIISRLRKKIRPSGYDVTLLRGKGYIFTKI